MAGHVVNEMGDGFGTSCMLFREWRMEFGNRVMCANGLGQVVMWSHV